jgi:hypothetical protein
VKVALVESAAASVTVTVNEYGVFLVAYAGVPEITPVLEFMVSPDGIAPDIVNVYGLAPPDTPIPAA